VTVRHGSAHYDIVVENPQAVMRGVAAAEVDGHAVAVEPLALDLRDDGLAHSVRVRLGARATESRLKSAV
jgi:cyclic beta-1,2-glucan synthetase